MRKWIVLSALLLTLSFSAFAQQSGEASFGYSNFTNGKNGWDLGLGYKVVKPVSVVADFGGYYRPSDDIHSFLAGFKVQSPVNHGLSPFGRFLIGGSHVSRSGGPSDTAGSWAVGGGVDAMATSQFGVRLSLDAFHTNFNNNGDLHLRTGLGVVYRF
ncbi:MAG: hypothetical protein P4M01_12335 [Acidobacteriota bacterium]|nr:hypothetical protein [Acidobacteriota bacterium]